MTCEVELDEIDVKILNALIKDARTKLKEIAEDCRVSSNTVVKRINHLKNIGVIVGTSLFPRAIDLGYTHVVTVGVNLDYAQKDKVIKLIQKQAHANIIELTSSLGKYDVCAFMFAKSLHELDNITQAIRKHRGVKRVAVNIWVCDPHLWLENLNLQPTKV